VLTCKITLPNSPHPIYISKNPGFRALYLARQNEFRFSFNKYKKILFSFLAAGFCPKKISFCPKNNGFAQVWGAAAPQPPGSYACVAYNVNAKVKLHVKAH